MDSKGLQKGDPQAAVAAGSGNIACVYTYVGNEADVDEVAADLRNQAPTVLFVCCCDSETAIRVRAALSKEAVNNETRGDGGKGNGRQARPSKEVWQVTFRCRMEKELIVAGRDGVAKEVDIKQILPCTPGGGPLLIAEVDFSVGIQQMLRVRVAVLGVRQDAVA